MEEKNVDEKKIVILKVFIGILCCFLMFFNTDVWQTICSGEFLNRKEIVEMFVQLFSVSCVLVGQCYVIAKFETLLKCYRQTDKPKGMAWAVFFATSLIFFCYPLRKSEITVDSFDRTFGIGVISGVDVDKIIANFSVNFLIFAIVLSSAMLLMNYIRNRNCSEQQKMAWDYLDGLLVFAFADLILKGIVYYQQKESGEQIFSYVTNILYLAIILEYIYIFLKLERKINLDKYHQIFFMTIGMSYPIAVICSRGWNVGKILIGVNVVLLTIAVLMVFFLNDIHNYKWKVSINSLTIITAFLPLVTFLYIELVNVLNQHNVFVGHPQKYYIIGILLYVLFAIPLYLWMRKKRTDNIQWKRLVYPVLVFGISCLSVQLPLKKTVNADLFETANSSVLISDFLNYGKIPIVENYGGHMLENVFGGLLYGILNNDYQGAIFNPYAELLVPILTLVFFYVLKKLLGENYAFGISMLFPFYESWSYFGMGMISCLALILFFKKNSYHRALLVWVACAWNVLYRLDLGVAFGGAVIGVALVWIVINKNWKALKQLFLTFVGVIVSGGIIWCSICLLKNVNPINRMIEFINISASNKNWAYSTLGNTADMAFSWSYLFLPLLVVGCLVYSVIAKRIRNHVSMDCYLILLVLGLSYCLNFSRGCVRHSLVEKIGVIMYWSASVFLAVFLSCYKKEKKIFLITFLGMMLVQSLFLQEGNFSKQSIANKATEKLGEVTGTWTEIVNQESNMTMWEEIKEKGEKVNRVEWSEELKEKIVPIQDVVEVLLDESETYVDFTNQNFMYAAMGRENPVYVVQSPGQLSGERSQTDFINEIKTQSEKIPLLLMPSGEQEGAMDTSLDGIANAVRYYKVAEYLYQNYRPLCMVSDTAIWCRNDCYEQYKSELMERKLEDLGLEENTQIFIDWGYDQEKHENEEEEKTYKGVLHNYYVAQLPYIWAEYDELQALENKVQIEAQRKEDNLFVLDAVDKVEKRNGNYLLLNIEYPIENPETFVEVELGNILDGEFQGKYQYVFEVKPGKHNYLLRISSDYYWYISEINAVRIKGLDVTSMEIKVLEGD